MERVKPSGSGSASAGWGGGPLLFIGTHPHPKARTVQALIAFGRRISHGYKVLAILVLNTLLIAAGLELASRALTDLRAGGSNESAPDPRERSSYYHDKAWAPQYWREFKSSRTTQYLPYVVWRRAPFTG